MRTLGFRLIVVGFMLSLAACQTTSGPTPTAITKLQAGGYEPSTAFADIVVKNVRINGVYLCPEEKCGALSLVAFGSIEAPMSPLGVTSEEQIRRRVFSDASLYKILRTAVGQGTSQDKMTVSFGSFRQFSDAQKAGFSFSMSMREKNGFSLKVLANAIVVGNQANVVMSFSTKDAQARRGLALAQN